MIISEKQLLCLIDILKDTLKYIEMDGQFSISRSQRHELMTAIINQQSDQLRVIE